MILFRVTRRVECGIHLNPGGQPHPLETRNLNLSQKWLRSPPLNHIWYYSGVTRRVECSIHLSPGVSPHPLPFFIFFKMVEIPTPKPYMILSGVTRWVECVVHLSPGVQLHLRETRNLNLSEKWLTSPPLNHIWYYYNNFLLYVG